MTTQTVINQQTISTKLLLTFFVAIIMAFAFVAFLTNMIVNSKVNAAYQSNPVTVAAPTQTNTAPAPVVVAGSCVLPAQGDASGAPGTVATASGGTVYLPWGGYAYGGSYSQSNSSVIETHSTNHYVTDSYNTAKFKHTDNRWSGNTLITDNGNSYTDNRNSGNTTNTTINTDNSDNSTNTNIQDSNNTTTLNTLIDNSQENNTAVGVGGLGVAVVVD